MTDTRGYSGAESRYLTNQQFLRLYKAVAVANLDGLLLNSFVTISWSLADVTEPSAIKGEQAELQQRMTKWLGYRRLRDRERAPFAAVWVKEVGRSLGVHSHYLMHVPQGHFPEFRHWIRRSVAKATDSPLGPVKTTRRGHQLYVTDVKDLSFSVDAQWKVLRYIAKGLDPEELGDVLPGSRRRLLATEYTGLSKLSQQGLLVGQRCGRSGSISDAAFRPWAGTYDEVIRAERRATGHGSLHYGPIFLTRGQLAQDMQISGI